MTFSGFAVALNQIRLDITCESSARLDITADDSHVMLNLIFHPKLKQISKEVLAIMRIFSLVDMITNTKFSNCPNLFKIVVVWQ